MSRPVLREAIRIVQSESLLTIRRGSKGGARVNAPQPEPVARLAGGLLQYERTTLFDVSALAHRVHRELELIG